MKGHKHDRDAAERYSLDLASQRHRKRGITTACQGTQSYELYCFGRNCLGSPLSGLCLSCEAISAAYGPSFMHREKIKKEAQQVMCVPCLNVQWNFTS